MNSTDKIQIQEALDGNPMKMSPRAREILNANPALKKAYGEYALNRTADIIATVQSMGQTRQNICNKIGGLGQQRVIELIQACQVAILTKSAPADIDSAKKVIGSILGIDSSLINPDQGAEILLALEVKYCPSQEFTDQDDIIFRIYLQDRRQEKIEYLYYYHIELKDQFKNQPNFVISPDDAKLILEAITDLCNFHLRLRIDQSWENVAPESKQKVYLQVYDGYQKYILHAPQKLDQEKFEKGMIQLIETACEGVADGAGQ